MNYYKIIVNFYKQLLIKNKTKVKLFVYNFFLYLIIQHKEIVHIKPENYLA